MIKNWNEFITETLKSHTIEVVCRRIGDYFKRLGFNEKEGFFGNVESPYFLLYHDRIGLQRQADEYRNPDKEKLKFMKKYYKDRGENVDPVDKCKEFADDYDRTLSEFKYGDISISTDKNSPEILKGLLNLIESLGYFVSVGNREIKDSYDKSKVSNKNKIFDELKDEKAISLMIEPYYDNEIKTDSEYLYHTTNRDNLQKILLKGLIPKSKNTRSFYPDRIYLSPDLENSQHIQKQLSADKGGDYVILRIQNFPGLKLYKDVRFSSGFFTYNNIAPKYIKVIK